MEMKIFVNLLASYYVLDDVLAVARCMLGVGEVAMLKFEK
jgi:hypothetical protein